VVRVDTDIVHIKYREEVRSNVNRRFVVGLLDRRGAMTIYWSLSV
jgi:hypothetical protein